MKQTFFTVLLSLCFLGHGFSQDDGADIQSEIDKISIQMEEMIKMLDGSMREGQILMDTFFIEKFDNLNGDDLGSMGIDAQNMEEALEEMMNQFQFQMQSLNEQDWDALKELFGGFGGAFQMPDVPQNDGAAPKQQKIKKKRKTTDL